MLKILHGTLDANMECLFLRVNLKPGINHSANQPIFNNWLSVMVTSTKKKYNPINHVRTYLCDWDNSLARVRRSCDVGFALYRRGVLWHRQWSGRCRARHCWPWRQIEQIVNDRHNKRTANPTCCSLQMTISGVKHPLVFVLVLHTHHMSIKNRKSAVTALSLSFTPFSLPLLSRSPHISLHTFSDSLTPTLPSKSVMSAFV